MNQPLLPSYSGGHLPTVYQNPDVGLVHGPDGVTYLTQKLANGQITLTPVNAVVSQSAILPAPQPVTQIQAEPVHRDREGINPLVLVGIILAAVLGLAFGAWFIGFLAGRSGRETVVVPREPICDTRRSSFLFWSHSERECH